MKIKLNKSLKLFFVFGMLFSQLCSPITVFAEVIDDSLNDNEIVAEGEDIINDEVVNDDDVIVDDEISSYNLDSSEENDLESTDEDVIPSENTDQDTILDDTNQEDNTDTENTDEPVLEAILDVTVTGNVNELSYDVESKTYTYEIMDVEEKNIVMTPVVTNSELGVVELVLNDKFNITEDFEFDFNRLIGGTYNFVFNLYEENEIVDSVKVIIISNMVVDTESYFEVTEETTLDDIAYMYLSTSTLEEYDMGLVLDKYLTLNNDMGMIFDSTAKTIIGLYGSTTNNVTTVSDVLNSINLMLGSLEESTDDTSIYTGFELVVTIMNEVYEYRVVAYGDVDTGYVTDSDIQKIIDFSIGSVTLDDLSIIASDVNRDGVTDILDVTNVIKAINTDSFVITDNTMDDSVNDVTRDVTEGNTQNVNDKYEISLSNKEEVRVNDEVVVSFEVAGFNTGSMNGLEGVLNYDETVLELVGVNSNVFGFGTLNYNNNKFMFADLVSVNADGTVLTLTFKAIGEGNTEISVSDVKLASDGKLLELVNNTTSSNLFVDRALSNDNNISNVIVSTGALNKEINETDTYYVINVGSDVNTINLNGLLSSDLAVSEGFGEYPLNGDHTIIQVKVIAENGEVKIYTFEVVREKESTITTTDKVVNTSTTYNYIKYSNDSYLEDLIIEGYEIEFDKYTYEYSITVGHDVDSLDITALLSDMDATYAVYGNNEFKEGENVVTVVVTAEDGSTTTYTIKVNKEAIEEVEETVEKENNNVVKTVVIVLIILVIIGLVYLIFKDDEEKEEVSVKNDKSSKRKK